MRKVAIIPARGGSKRIKHKNIKLFCGKPIISYPIKTTLDSELFDEVIISTDSEAIAKIAKDYGANVPFMRPNDLSDDATPMQPVILHAINALGLTANDIVCAIYPTSVFLTINLLDNVLTTILDNHQVHYAFSAVKYDYNPLRSFYIRDNAPCMLFPAHYYTRSQDLDVLFYDAAQCYGAKVSTWQEGKPIFSPQSKAIIISSLQAQDIDTLDDFALAEMKYKMLHYRV